MNLSAVFMHERAPESRKDVAKRVHGAIKRIKDSQTVDEQGNTHDLEGAKLVKELSVIFDALQSIEKVRLGDTLYDRNGVTDRQVEKVQIVDEAWIEKYFA
jgi:hypothetical protein